MSTETKKKGLLLVNLGTPSELTVKGVREYLGQFLMDPYVIDIPYIFRWLLVHGIVLRTRPAKSLEAYEKVWRPDGSPLKVFSMQLLEQVKSLLKEDYQVALGMRYGKPSIEDAIDSLAPKNLSQLIVAPLYPQYAQASTQTAVESAKAHLSKHYPNLEVFYLPPFYNHPEYIKAQVAVASPHLEGKSYDHVLFTYHGLPVKQIRKTDPTGTHCQLNKECCKKVPSYCYRAQCFETSAQIASQLGIDNYSDSFQSGFGKSEWLKPNTEHKLVELAKSGVKNLLVFSPSFVADCLETLEELEVRGKEVFQEAGGENITLVPSLNAHPQWASALTRMLDTASKQIPM